MERSCNTKFEGSKWSARMVTMGAWLVANAVLGGIMGDPCYTWGMVYPKPYSNHKDPYSIEFSRIR